MTFSVRSRQQITFTQYQAALHFLRAMYIEKQAALRGKAPMPE